MEEKKNYAELLKDPRWQMKRLEILQRDNFTCQHCGRKDKELHVHHTKYKRRAKPWEYDNKYLITLCKKCHLGTHETTISTKNSVRMKRVVIPTMSKHYTWIKGGKKEKAFLHIDDIKIELSKYQLEYFRNVIDKIIQTI